MAIAISNNHVIERLGGQVKRLSDSGLGKKIAAFLREYRRNQYLLKSSYQNYPVARRMPKRKWDRYCALFTLMDDFKSED